MNQNDRIRAIVEQAQLVIEQTELIQTAVGTLKKRIAARIAAVNRLGYLVDVRLEVDVRQGEDGYARVLADLLLLTIYRTGELGAKRAALNAAVHKRYGDLFSNAVIQNALQGLVRTGEIIDRHNAWYAPFTTAEHAPAGTPPMLKAKVLKVLEMADRPLRLKDFMARYEEVIGLKGHQPSISPILTRMVRAGRVRYEDHRYMLIPVDERLDRGDVLS